MNLISPIRSNLTFFLFLFLFGSVCIVTEPWEGSRLMGLAELPFDLYVFCALLLLIPTKVRSAVKVVASGFLYVIGFIDSWCYHVLNMPITASLLQLVLLTNRQEAREAIATYWNPSVLLTPLGLLLLIATAHAAVSLIRTVGGSKGKELGGSSLSQNNPLTPHLSLFTSNKNILNPLLAVVLCASFAVSLPDKERFITSNVLHFSFEETEEREIFFNVNTRANQYLPVYRLRKAVTLMRNYERELERLPAIAAQVTVDSCSFTSPTIVLIIGESYNRRHAQIYGYPKATTSCQQERLSRGEIQLFTDVVSAWNLTALSFQDMFSLKTQDAPGAWYDYPLFTTMFRLAGYEVTFLSNQYVLSLEGRMSDFLEDLFVNEPRMSDYQFSSRNLSTHQYDDGLLADYDSLRANGQWSMANGQLIIFHFLGLHAAFGERYPAECAHFTPADYQRQDLSAADLQELSDYDNAMRYNDTVIEGILQRMEQQEAIVVCLADHGERIFDYGTTAARRSMALNTENVRQQYEIPFWIWYTNKYREKHPDICQQIADAKDRPWTTALLGHLLLYLGGISSHAYYHDEANILSPQFRPTERIVGGKCSYEHYVSPSTIH